ncbi:hypothetical protein BCD64_27540 [Nostoc sp. MBR 210]|nr:hypothetical protein BCD64_27540 [Nostoc sp. MBR 210]
MYCHSSSFAATKVGIFLHYCAFAARGSSPEFLMYGWGVWGVWGVWEVWGVWGERFFYHPPKK